MSTAFNEVLERLTKLSIDELWNIQEVINKDLRLKLRSASTEGENGNNTGVSLNIPGLYRPTIQEVEAHLARLFTPEQLAQMDQIDISTITLPPGAITTEQILAEDREDRF